MSSSSESSEIRLDFLIARFVGLFVALFGFRRTSSLIISSSLVSSFRRDNIDVGGMTFTGGVDCRGGVAGRGLCGIGLNGIPRSSI